MRPSKQSKRAALVVVACYLLAGAVDASASRPSANDNQQLRQLCEKTTSTRMAGNRLKANPEAANRCYAQAVDKLQPSVYVDGGEVYLKYKNTGRVRVTRSTTYQSKVAVVNGVYTNTMMVQELPKEVQHLRRVVITEGPDL